MNNENRCCMELEFARNFYDLVVYQKARTLQGQILELTLRFPESERFGLTVQIRCASRSIGGQIAEAWGKRLYPRHFVSKLTDAISEALETQHWLITAADAGYFDREEATPEFKVAQEIVLMLGKMVRQHKTFCLPSPSTLREEPAEYYIAACSDAFSQPSAHDLLPSTTY